MIWKDGLCTAFPLHKLSSFLYLAHYFSFPLRYTFPLISSYQGPEQAQKLYEKISSVITFPAPHHSVLTVQGLTKKKQAPKKALLHMNKMFRGGGGGAKNWLTKSV